MGAPGRLGSDAGGVRRGVRIRSAAAARRAPADGRRRGSRARRSSRDHTRAMRSSSARARTLTNIARWLLFIAAAWLVLRPALIISLSYDDFYNPVRLRELLGANPFHI